MESSYKDGMELYYKKLVELQEKLREREQIRCLKLQLQCRKLIDKDRKRQERNEAIIKSLEKIEMRMNVLANKTKQLELIRTKEQVYPQKCHLLRRAKSDWKGLQETERTESVYSKTVHLGNYDKKTQIGTKSFGEEIKDLGIYPTVTQKFNEISDDAKTLAEFMSNSIASRYYNKNTPDTNHLYEIDNEDPKKATHDEVDYQKVVRNSNLNESKPLLLSPESKKDDEKYVDEDKDCRTYPDLFPANAEEETIHSSKDPLVRTEMVKNSIPRAIEEHTKSVQLNVAPSYSEDICESIIGSKPQIAIQNTQSLREKGTEDAHSKEQHYGPLVRDEEHDSSHQRTLGNDNIEIHSSHPPESNRQFSSEEAKLSEIHQQVGDFGDNGSKLEPHTEEPNLVLKDDPPREPATLKEKSEINEEPMKTDEEDAQMIVNQNQNDQSNLGFESHQTQQYDDEQVKFDGSSQQILQYDENDQPLQEFNQNQMYQYEQQYDQDGGIVYEGREEFQQNIGEHDQAYQNEGGTQQHTSEEHAGGYDQTIQGQFSGNPEAYQQGQYIETPGHVDNYQHHEEDQYNNGREPYQLSEQGQYSDVQGHADTYEFQEGKQYNGLNQEPPEAHQLTEQDQYSGLKEGQGQYNVGQVPTEAYQDQYGDSQEQTEAHQYGDQSLYNDGQQHPEAYDYAGPGQYSDEQGPTGEYQHAGQGQYGGDQGPAGDYLQAGQGQYGGDQGPTGDYLQDGQGQYGVDQGPTGEYQHAGQGQYGDDQGHTGDYLQDGQGQYGGNQGPTGEYQHAGQGQYGDDQGPTEDYQQAGQGQYGGGQGPIGEYQHAGQGQYVDDQGHTGDYLQDGQGQYGGDQGPTGEYQHAEQGQYDDHQGPTGDYQYPEQGQHSESQETTGVSQNIEERQYNEEQRPSEDHHQSVQVHYSEGQGPTE